MKHAAPYSLMAESQGRLRRPRHRAVPTYCETHDEAGACTQECVDLTVAMTGDDWGGESMVYSDYLGGTSSIDVSGCHGGPPSRVTTYYLDAERGRVASRTVHPYGCECPTSHGEPILCPMCDGQGNPFCPVCGGDAEVMAVQYE